jgi:hypothetical protein
MIKGVRVDLCVSSMEINQLYDVMLSFNKLYNLYIQEKEYDISPELQKQSAICLLPCKCQKDPKISFELINLNEIFSTCAEDFVNYFTYLNEEIRNSEFINKFWEGEYKHLKLLLNSKSKIIFNNGAEHLYVISLYKVMNYNFTSMNEYILKNKIRIYLYPNVN